LNKKGNYRPCPYARRGVGNGGIAPYSFYDVRRMKINMNDER
jgi:hypothetical protein